MLRNPASYEGLAGVEPVEMNNLEASGRYIIDTVNKDGRTALIRAAANGQVGVIMDLLLLTGNTIINKRDSFGNTALIHAVYHGNIDAMNFLLAVTGVDVNAANKHGDTALIWAAEKGYTDFVKALLAKPAIINVNAVNNYGKTAEMVAANADIRNALLSFTANAAAAARLNVFAEMHAANDQPAPEKDGDNQEKSNSNRM